MSDHGPASIVLGIDLGTTGVKVLALDARGGRVLAAVGQEYPSLQTGDGGHEQRPESWWDAVAGACRELMVRLDVAPVAVGLSGQMHSLLLLDEAGRPVRPAMTWADRRVGEHTRRLASSPLFARRAGNDPVDAFTAPKLAWLAAHEPASLATARHLVLAKDWIALRLTGVIGTDPTDAMGTLLWDARAGRWDPELFGLCDAPASLVVPVRGSAQIVGEVRGDASAHTGIPEGTPVMAGAGDVSAAAFGAGAVAGRTMCLNVGTAAQVMAMTADVVAGPGFAFGSATGEGFVCMASVYAAGASIRWFETTELDGGSIGEAAHDSPAGARGLSYLPFMFGATVPRKNDAVRGGFVGEEDRHTRADRAAAVLEGVAYACADVVEAVASVAERPERLVIVGGVTASQRFRRALAASLDVTILRMPDAGSGLGACLLAGVGAGVIDDAGEVLSRLPAEEVAPDPAAGAYREARTVFSERVELVV